LILGHAQRAGIGPEAAEMQSFARGLFLLARQCGAAGLAADVTMLVGNGYVPGHAAYALELLRGNASVRALFEGRLAE
jgi:L-erythro-3,5-diaminohexanoate dehydrogenase